MTEHVVKASRLSLFTISVLLSLFLFADTSAVMGLTVRTDSPAYSTGDMITITGAVHEPKPGWVVIIEVTDPHSRDVWAELIEYEEVTDDNTFEVRFIAGEDEDEYRHEVMDTSGTYLVTASYVKRGGLDEGYVTSSEETTFEFTSDSGSGATNEENQQEISLPLRLAAMEAQDMTGNDIGNSISRSQQIMLTFGSDNIGNSVQPYVALIQVSAQDGSTDYLTWQTGSSSVGEVSNFGFAWESEEAGTFTVKAFLWTSLSSPTPLSEPSEIEIRVA